MKIKLIILFLIITTSCLFTNDVQARNNSNQGKPSCCKVCKTGKACGNSCISRSYTCHKVPGCACDNNY